MFTGTTIEQLINAVEIAEQQACTSEVTPSATAPCCLDMPPAFTYMYDLATMQPLVIGVA